MEEANLCEWRHIASPIPKSHQFSDLAKNGQWFYFIVWATSDAHILPHGPEVQGPQWNNANWTHSCSGPGRKATLRNVSASKHAPPPTKAKESADYLSQLIAEGWEEGTIMTGDGVGPWQEMVHVLIRKNSEGVPKVE